MEMTKSASTLCVRPSVRDDVGDDHDSCFWTRKDRRSGAWAGAVPVSKQNVRGARAAFDIRKYLVLTCGQSVNQSGRQAPRKEVVLDA